MNWTAQMTTDAEDTYIAEFGTYQLQLSRGIDGEDSNTVVLDIIDYGSGDCDVYFSAPIDYTQELTAYNFKHAEQLAHKLVA